MATTKKCILVCDDEADVVNIVKRILEAEGHEVICAYDGLEVFPRLNERAPDLIIIDRMMPGMNGLEVVSRLKETPKTSSIPVIMLTSMGKFDDVIEGYQHGADCYITKPFTKNHILGGVKLVTASRPELPADKLDANAVSFLRACYQLSRRTEELTARFAAQEGLSASAWLYKGLEARLRADEMQVGVLEDEPDWRYCFHGWGVDYFNTKTGEEVNLAIGPGGRCDTLDEWRVQCFIETAAERGAGFTDLQNVIKGHMSAVKALTERLSRNQWIEPAQGQSPPANQEIDAQLGDRWIVSAQGAQLLDRS